MNKSFGELIQLGLFILALITPVSTDSLKIERSPISATIAMVIS